MMVALVMLLPMYRTVCHPPCDRTLATNILSATENIFYLGVY